MNGYRVAIGIAQRVSSSSIVGLEKTKVTTDSTSGSEDLQHGDLEMIHDKENEVSSTGNTLQADFRSEKSFPFMKLPPEIRNTIYEMALWELVSPSQRRARRASDQQALTSRNMPAVAALQRCLLRGLSLIFSQQYLLLLRRGRSCEFLTKLTIQQRRNIRSLSFHFSDGLAPAKAMRLLRGCVSLRDLTISFTRSTLHEFGLRMPESLKRLPGLGDLLKVRGIQELQIIVPLALPYSRYYSFNGEVSPESFIKDLQVLKLPRSAASLRRQDEKDFPPEKAGRTVFGKANVITRSEKAMIDGNEER
ncbi:MAG: hypothetical protein Q9176_003881 [Flavoplaca citrina]